jgi:DNA mismatch repair protein MutS
VLKYYFSNNQSQTLGFSLVTKLCREEYIAHMNTISNYVGRIDCLITVTKLLDEKYTVPTFVENKFPILHIENMGYPSIPDEITVRNSLIMDVTQPNVMILTGPNKAGKSTYMRSIIVSTYLAQSLGICCAERMSLTPFRDICTYLNVPDTIGRESLFEAEINRCYNYIEKTESLRGFSLGIIDELFTGTNSKEGKAGTYAILKKLSVNPTNITILSTHYSKILPRLAGSSNNFILNKFTVDVSTNLSKDQYNYDYKIKSGISDQSIGLRLLKEKGFDKEIIDDALDFIKKSHNDKKIDI